MAWAYFANIIIQAYPNGDWNKRNRFMVSTHGAPVTNMFNFNPRMG